MAETDVFKHSTPALYDRYMGPLLFAPYAEYVAKRVALLRPKRILETAAGTGIVTRAVHEALPEAEVVATDINPAVEAAGEAVAALFPEDPHYMERGPFSYTDPGLVEQHVRSAGFGNIELETVQLSTMVSARDAACGIVLGSPFRGEIERLDPTALERATAAVEEALQPWDGTSTTLSAHLVTAAR